MFPLEARIIVIMQRVLFCRPSGIADRRLTVRCPFYSCGEVAMALEVTEPWSLAQNLTFDQLPLEYDAPKEIRKLRSEVARQNGLIRRTSPG